jgi:menaquinone-dependent protoporphyrinogen oxidase
MDVLIVYGTTEGQTRKIAEWTATHLRERGHQVELSDSAAFASDFDVGTFHAFVIAASVPKSTIKRPSQTSRLRIRSC